jgi:hypothetical protein
MQARKKTHENRTDEGLLMNIREWQLFECGPETHKCHYMCAICAGKYACNRKERCPFCRANAQLIWRQPCFDQPPNAPQLLADIRDPGVVRAVFSYWQSHSNPPFPLEHWQRKWDLMDDREKQDTVQHINETRQPPPPVDSQRPDFWDRFLAFKRYNEAKKKDGTDYTKEDLQKVWKEMKENVQKDTIRSIRAAENALARRAKHKIQTRSHDESIEAAAITKPMMRPS